MWSLWQPWASLIAVGVKTIETRTAPAPADLIGQRVAIHASTTRARDHVFTWLERSYPDAYRRVIHDGDRAALPCGAVLATARLRETRPSDFDDWDATLSPVEGLWAWVLDELEVLPSPLPFAGESGLFEVPWPLQPRGL